MPIPIFSSGKLSAKSYKSVVALGQTLGMNAFWLPDPGRLQNAIAHTIQRVSDRGGLKGVMAGKIANTPLLADDALSHGIEGIFGQEFTKALADKSIMLEVEFIIQGGYLIYGEYRLSL